MALVDILFAGIALIIVSALAEESREGVNTCSTVPARRFSLAFVVQDHSNDAA